ncbi:MAG TPA: nucleotidyltransferase [Gemmatimonadaceae bacterium]|nr:nucleotidyltransferase [Gemmatimonadaceae bacterium]
MTYQSTLEDPGRDTNTFYRRTLHVLSDAHVRFLVGGSHAYLQYTGIVRPTKDFDLFLRREDIEAALDALRDAGYRTEIAFPHWLAKAHQSGDHVDLVFSSGNGLCRVDDEWFAHAIDADVLGMPVKIAPVEEFLWQKAFVMERERFDGADLMHLMRHCAEMIDWQRLLRRFDRYWPLFLTYLTMFSFVYPSEVHRIPKSIFNELVGRLQTQLASGDGADGNGAVANGTERVCQGTLVSRGQYMIDIGQYGFLDARVRPRGNMSPEDTIFWTWAIENVD